PQHCNPPPVRSPRPQTQTLRPRPKSFVPDPTVNRDNTVSIQNLSLQIEAVRWRASLAGCTVTVHQHLDGSYSLTHGPHRLGRYSAQGATLADNKTQRGRAAEKPRGGKAQNPTFP